ncbi:MAG: TIGR03086 family metal-binding protein [Acidimicrobiales bacterium]|jgi:uncharacterized protein (TIGR03086 family)
MTTPIDVDMLERACNITDRILSGVQPGQLGDATPCRDWTVLELMEHIVASTDFFADAAEYGAVAEDRAWAEYPPEELLSAYRHHAGRLVAAFRVPGVMGRPMVILAGPPTAAFCLQIAISERFVHAWDLAAATGQSFGDDGVDIAEALLASSEYLAVNSEVRGNTPPPLGPELAAEGQGAVERLVAFLGRDPSQATG